MKQIVQAALVLACAVLVLAPFGPAPAASWEAADFRPPGSGYHDLEATGRLLEQWCAAGGEWCVSLDLGRSRGGREVPAILFGAPGDVPLDERPTLFLVGGLDGVSFSGSEAVLRVAHSLLLGAGPQLAGVAFVAVPWGAPDGLSAAFEGRRMHGRDDLGRDADGDGVQGEDPPDDVDGDGRVLEMLVEDPAGPWVLAADGRLPLPVREGDGPRYRLVPEGRDDDGDGRFNEDDGSGVRIDSVFPIGWRPGVEGGALPLEGSATRRLADEVLARPTAGVIVMQGNHGLLARPGGIPPDGICGGDDALTSDADAPLFDRLARAFAAHTRRAQTSAPPLHVANGGERPGTFVDWCYAVPGVVAVELAPWGQPLSDPEGLGPQRPAATDRGDDLGPADEPLWSGPPLPPRERAWARWLDEERGGIGFVPWHEVELGPGPRALVGGWEPRTFRNPPEEDLPAALAGIDALVRDWGRWVSRVELRIEEDERDGEQVHIVARVANPGAFPTGLSTDGLWTAAGGRGAERGARRGARRGGARGPGLAVRLVLPVGARLLAGDERQVLPPLAGGSVSAPLEWLLLAPEGSTFTLEVVRGRRAPVTKELRP